MMLEMVVDWNWRVTKRRMTKRHTRCLGMSGVGLRPTSSSSYGGRLGLGCPTRTGVPMVGLLQHIIVSDFLITVFGMTGRRGCVV